jgi:hypothetical protein
MKVRWTARSLRLRITPSELEGLRRGEAVTEAMRVGAWSVRLERGAESALESDGAALLVGLSDADFNVLQMPHSEGVYLERDGFKYYVEKDFPCEHPRAVEAQEASSAETFARPPQSS